MWQLRGFMRYEEASIVTSGLSLRPMPRSLNLVRALRAPPAFRARGAARARGDRARGVPPPGRCEPELNYFFVSVSSRPRLGPSKRCRNRPAAQRALVGAQWPLQQAVRLRASTPSARALPTRLRTPSPAPRASRVASRQRWPRRHRQMSFKEARLIQSLGAVRRENLHGHASKVPRNNQKPHGPRSIHDRRSIPTRWLVASPITRGVEPYERAHIVMNGRIRHAYCGRAATGRFSRRCRTSSFSRTPSIPIPGSNAVLTRKLDSQPRGGDDIKRRTEGSSPISAIVCA